jgi:sigma-54-specific transcriptional regulator
MPLHGLGVKVDDATAASGSHSQVAVAMPLSAAGGTGESQAHADIVGGGLVLLGTALQALLQEGHQPLFDAVESSLVHAAFSYAGQNQVKTAKVLGITRNMLRTQLQRHGLLSQS